MINVHLRMLKSLAGTPYAETFHATRSFIGPDRLLMDVPCASALERPPVAKAASGDPKTFSCTHYEIVLSKANMHRHFTGAKHELLSSTVTQSVVVSNGNAVMHGWKSFKSKKKKPALRWSMAATAVNMFKQPCHNRPALVCLLARRPLHGIPHRSAQPEHVPLPALCL